MTYINENEYKDIVLKSKGVVLVDFFATWCMPCRMLSAVLEDFEDATKIPVYKIDIDQNTNLPREFGVLSIPTVCIFKDGEFKEKFVGYKNIEEIKDIIEKYNK